MPSRIDPQGNVIRDEANNNDDNLLSSFSSNPKTIDVFGFNLEYRQLFLVLGIIGFMLGFQGTLALLVGLGMYTIYSRRISSSSSSSSSSWGNRGGGGGGGGSSSKRSGGRGGSGGSNIHGIKDLPCDPKVG